MLRNYNVIVYMSINIFQFLKQGTTLNRNTLQLNKDLEQKIAPVDKNPNKTYFDSGKFNESDDEEFADFKKMKLSEEAIQAYHEKN